MKLIFEGKILKDIIQEMEDVLAVIAERKVEAPWPEPLPDLGFDADPPRAKPVEKSTFRPGDWPTAIPAGLREQLNNAAEEPVDKPVEKKQRTEKQKANDERLRERAKENPFGRNTIKAAAPVKPEMVMPPPPKTAEGMDPAEVARNRLRTISELQEAYANGHQKEVFELLSRFGNGAKSFRELPPESFVPIREAIDNGGLT